MKVILALFILHAVCDYPLQGEFLSRAKNRRTTPYAAWFPWYMALGCHSLIQAGGVLLITGSFWLTMAELAAHALIDFLKSEDCFGVNVDQCLHLFCKVLWVGILLRFPGVY